MISKIARISFLGLRKQIKIIPFVGQTLHSLNKNGYLNKRIVFKFSKDKQEKNNKIDQKVIDIEMNSIDQQVKKPKQKDQQGGMTPSRFGNSIFMISAVAMIIAYAFMQIQILRTSKKTKGVVNNKVVGVGKAQIGGSWQLLDTEGKPFSSQNLEGSYYLIYFGFTNCPDICPNSLTKLSKAVQKIRKSNEAKFYNLKTIFVSVDPDRDTGQKLKKFTQFFDPQMIGVTGKQNNDPALRQCMKKFKIYSTKLEFEDEETVKKGRKSYTIDHTILTYLMSDTNQYLTHLGANLGEYDLINLIQQKIREDKQQKLSMYKM